MGNIRFRLHCYVCDTAPTLRSFSSKIFTFLGQKVVLKALLEREKLMQFLIDVSVNRNLFVLSQWIALPHSNSNL